MWPFCQLVLLGLQLEQNMERLPRGATSTGTWPGLQGVPPAVMPERLSGDRPAWAAGN